MAFQRRVRRKRLTCWDGTTTWLNYCTHCGGRHAWYWGIVDIVTEEENMPGPCQVCGWKPEENKEGT